MRDLFYLCVVCNEPIEIDDSIQHILRAHPVSPIAFAIRYEIDRARVEAVR